MLNRPRNTLERFTVGGGGAPAWSRDGKRIAFANQTDGLYVRNADGTGDAQLLLKSPSRPLFAASWLPNGKSVVFAAAGRTQTKADIGLITLGDTTPRWLMATDFNETQPQVSPDARWIAYASDRTGTFEVYVQPLVGEGPRVQISNTGGNAPRWSPDSRTLYYFDGRGLTAAQRAPGVAFEIASRKPIGETPSIDLNPNNVNWDIHPDGKKFMFIDQSGGGGQGAGQHIVWIRDWPELVKTMATGK
jgi:Tol biopolymer transport system component